MGVKIHRVEYGNIHINGKAFTSTDILIHPGGVEEIEKTHEPTLKEFEEFLLHEPRAIIYGTGFKDQVVIDPVIRHAASAQGVDLHILQTPHALEKFRELTRQGVSVVARIHITD